MMTRWEEISEDSKGKKKEEKVKRQLSFGIRESILEQNISSFWKDILLEDIIYKYSFMFVFVTSNTDLHSFARF